MGSLFVASGIKWKRALGIQSGALFYEKMQLDLFTNINYSQLTEELFTAYFDCRKNKRNTQNALRFEKHLEKNVFQLIDEIYQGKYQLGSSIAFIVNKPVKREIFAADFRDRVVHHWLINKLNPLFEHLFIQDSYACRVGKGTHYGVQRADRFIKIRHFPFCSFNKSFSTVRLCVQPRIFFVFHTDIFIYSSIRRV